MSRIGRAPALVLAGTALLIAGCAVPPGGGDAGLPVLSADAQAARYAAVQHALETERSGRAVGWTDPGGSARGLVRPLSTMRSRLWGWCRDYEERVVAAGQSDALVGIACRSPSRRWLVLDIRPVPTG